jgi:hypothetical protein
MVNNLPDATKQATKTKVTKDNARRVIFDQWQHVDQMGDVRASRCKCNKISFFFPLDFSDYVSYPDRFFLIYHRVVWVLIWPRPLPTFWDPQIKGSGLTHRIPD